jgi:hypothetical protein
MDSAYRFDADSDPDPTFQFMPHGMGACIDILASRCGQRYIYEYPTEKELIENN